MPGEPPRINYIQSPLVPLNEFRNLVKDHLAILIEAGQEFPEHRFATFVLFKARSGYWLNNIFN